MRMNLCSAHSPKGQFVPKVTGTITQHGALVRVKFIPTGRGGIPIIGLGILDTGASHTHIDEDTARIHRFRTLGKVSLSTASQRDAETQTFEVSVELVDFPNLQFQVRALAFPAPKPPPNQPPADRMMALIGHDILESGCFIFDGAGGTFTLEMP